MDVANETKQVIANALRLPVEQLTDDARLQDLGAESIDMIEIMFQLEEKFDVELTVNTAKSGTGRNDQPDMKLEDFQTVGDVCRALQSIVVAKAAR